MTTMSVSSDEEPTSVDDEKSKRLLRAAKTSSTEERTSDVIKSEEGIEERAPDEQQLTSERVLAEVGHIPHNKSPVVSTAVDDDLVAHAQEFWYGLSEPDMLALIKIFVKRTKKNLDENLSLFDTLSAIYGDINVAKMFVAAKYLDDYRGRAAKKLLDEKLKGIMDRHCSVDRFIDVYDIKGDDMFTSSLWKVTLLKDFIEILNADKARYVTLADALVTAYGGEKGLMRVLLKRDNDVEARHVLDEIAKRWYRKNLSVIGTMRLLELSEVDNAFDNKCAHYVEGLFKQCREKGDWEDDFIYSDTRIYELTGEEYVDEFMAVLNSEKETVDYVEALVDFYDHKTLAVMISKAQSFAEGDAEMTARIDKATSMVFQDVSEGKRGPAGSNQG
uniref:Uncharacterized protein n=1 Tax=Peronospora matthiolae TaxID=2874970 RepID=A0AAV1UKK7_9STRA